ncbi:ABC transporter ATP-binding protein [Actinomyces sp. S6-Spd3]|jgi:polyamine ABC transporter, ATP-binding protein|uniref:ABC transporter ATP-binding protein n=1 Tax=Actinomyces sp. S6-Spd3 TaxID=1284680 RepID=UPI00050E7483|nr:ABC transporter ATP-binding protein [Actinomyces sp. S6-Spd3]KGF00290.1 ABC transporter ATP-binding protein [Actinomyces sp. S6-Spd3]MBF0949581.1 ABC transporter ATP-binding protein [Actinomyces sp.]
MSNTNDTNAPGRLSLVELTKTFSNTVSDVTAVDHINLDIRPGEFITLLGPSGCGKTTTLRMIAGFEDATSGQVMLDGENMVVVPPNRRPMSMVFQSYALFPHLSVRENVAYGLRLRKKSAEEIKEEVDIALAAMNLTAMADRAPSQLSGGQQQRVALARAMVVRPKVLLFDEPLSNLDAKLRVKMRVEIRRMQKRLGISSVYVTHDQSEAMAMSDRIVVMNSGRIEQVDTPEEIYLHPASVFVADFVGRANFVPAQAQEVGEDGMAEIEALGQKIRVHSSEGAKEAVREGKETVVLVRPESMRIQPTDEKPATLTGSLGQVVTSIFYGETVEYEIETEFGSLVCVVSDPRAEDLLEEGQYVRLGIEAEKAWLLPSGELASA